MNPEPAQTPCARVEEFRDRHRTGLMVLVFTDLVDSVALRRQLGDQAATSVLQAHRQLVRDTLARFPDAEEIETAGDSFLLLLARPSDAVKFAVLIQRQTHALATGRDLRLAVRMGIHVGEVVIEHHERGPKPKDLYGTQIDLCARVMGLAEGGQILLTRGVFDSARQALKGDDIEGVKELSWLHHGPYLLKGIEEAEEVCEVGEVGIGVLRAPAGSEKAQRQVAPESEPVLGWRPALGQAVPHTQWVLEKKLGEGGFGEVWLGCHQKLRERRVFKFCFRADRVRSLKREMTLFRLIKERIGDHPNIVRLLEVNFNEPPFYVVMDHVEGQDLKAWCEQQGGAEKIPLAARLEIVAQIADALQAAHDAGVIHRDVKPANILIAERGVRNAELQPSQPSFSPSSSNTLHSELRTPHLEAKLTDFGIGQVVSEEALKGITQTGFTQTIVAESSSSQTGSQMYMAPELLAGKPASTRSDIFSLGVVLYQLLVGDLTRPLTTDWMDHISDPLLRDDLKHCFAGNPQDRFAGAGQLAKHLRALPERQAALEKQQAALAAAAKAAYRRGIVRTAVAAAVIVVAVTILAVSAVQQRNRARAEESTHRRLRYAAEVNLAQHALADGNIDRALELLEAQRPKPGQPDLRGFEWRFLRQLCHSDEMATLRGHKDVAQSVAVSPDGRILASGDGWVGTVHVWDVATRRELIAPLPANRQVRSVFFSRDGKLLIAGGDGQTSVRLWETTTWREVAALGGHAARVERVAISPDGKWLAAATIGEEAATLWSLATTQRVATFRGPSYVRACVAFSPDGQWLAFGRGDKTVALVEVHTRREIGSLRGHENVVTYLDFSPDSSTLASASSDGTVKLWDVTTQREVGALVGHKAHVTSVAFSPDGRTLATSCSDSTIKLWDFASRKELGTLLGHTKWVNNVVFFPDGKTLASGSDDTTVKLWDARPRTQDYLLGGGTNQASFVEISPDGRLLATGQRDGSLMLWNLASQQPQRTLRAPTGSITACLFSPDKKTLATVGDDNVVRLWDIAANTGPELRSIKEPSIRGALFAGDGRMLATLGEKTVKLWEVATGKEAGAFERDGLNFLRLSSEGRILAFVQEQNRIQGWDALNGQLVATLNGDTDQYGWRVASPDFRTAVSQGPDFKLWLWQNGVTGPVGVLPGHTEIIRALEFSPDGKVLATGSQDNTIKLWDIARKREIATLRGHSGWVTMVAFSPDGKTLASASMDGTVKLWSLASHREVLTMPGHIAPTLQLVSALRFVLDGDALVCFGEDGLGRLWRAPTLAEIEAEEAKEKTQVQRP